MCRLRAAKHVCYETHVCKKFNSMTLARKNYLILYEKLGDSSTLNKVYRLRLQRSVIRSSCLLIKCPCVTLLVQRFLSAPSRVTNLLNPTYGNKSPSAINIQNNLLEFSLIYMKENKHKLRDCVKMKLTTKVTQPTWKYQVVDKWILHNPRR